MNLDFKTLIEAKKVVYICYMYGKHRGELAEKHPTRYTTQEEFLSTESEEKEAGEVYSYIMERG